jgi:hypothetical protein
VGRGGLEAQAWSHVRTRSRLRGLVTAGALSGLLLASAGTRADSASVPLGLQVELFTKVAEYDKTLPGRSEGIVRTLVVTRSRVPESASAAARVLKALSNIERVSGLPHEDSAVEFMDVSSLAGLCKARSVSILYLTPGLTDIDQPLSEALVGTAVLTVSASAEGVSKGIVLGFDLVGGKPKLIVNLRATRDQGVRLSADVLKIATVIE